MLIREFDFEGAIVTISEVEIGEDLDRANVKLSIIPFEKEPEMYKMIEARKKELQHKLLKKMNVRPMPQIHFMIESHKDGVMGDFEK